MPPLPRTGHDFEPQAAPWHARSHLQACEQRTSPHELSPMQVMLQNERASHSTSLQAPAPVQLTVHVQPPGQVMVPAQSLALVQSTWHVCATSSHDVQSAGQFGATQYPPVQTRLGDKPVQSAVLEHTRSSVGRLTKHATTHEASRMPPSVVALT